MMPGATQAHQAIILAGGGGSKMHPLNNGGIPKVLLPVANKVLLTFPLRTLEDAGINEVFVVCQGDGAAASVKSWLASSHIGIAKVEVVNVNENTGAVDALREVLTSRIKTSSFILLRGDVITDASLRSLLMVHHLNNAAVTALLFKRKISPATETKPGYAPRGVDYIGVTDDGSRIVCHVHSPETVRELRMSAAAAQHWGRIDVRTDLVDLQVYIFNTKITQRVLDSNPNLKHLESHLIPYMINRQLCPPPSIHPESTSTPTVAEATNTATITRAATLDLNSGSGSSRSLQQHHQDDETEWYCAAYLLPPGSYCQRANTVQAYADANKEVVGPDLATRVLRESPNDKSDNFVHVSVQTGTKTTISAGSMVGQDSTLGDKSTVKRSVIGRNCKIGSNVKILNSVLMDNIKVADGCYIQNCVVASGCQLLEQCSLRDCHVAANVVVEEDADEKGEVLRKD